jgi:hypothetical protein
VDPFCICAAGSGGINRMSALHSSAARVERRLGRVWGMGEGGRRESLDRRAKLEVSRTVMPTASVGMAPIDILYLRLPRLFCTERGTVKTPYFCSLRVVAGCWGGGEVLTFDGQPLGTYVPPVREPGPPSEGTCTEPPGMPTLRHRETCIVAGV